jgi:hypothetical protein
MIMQTLHVLQARRRRKAILINYLTKNPQIKVFYFFVFLGNSRYYFVSFFKLESKKKKKLI